MNTANSHQYQIIWDQLDRELESLSLLNDLLRAERDCLKTWNPERLMEISQQKATQVENIQSLSKKRESTMRQMGFGLDQEAQLRFFESAISQNKRRQQTWDNFISATQKCQEENRMNGAIVAASLQRNQSALRILHGSSADDTYGASGHANKGHSSQNIAKA